MSRIYSGILVAILAFGLSSNAVAQTASSYDASVVDVKPLAGYDNGFFLRSADDAFSLGLKTRIQFQHFYTDVRGGGTDQNSFRLRRARVYFVGKAFENFEFTALVNHSSSSNTGATSGVTSASGACGDCTVPASLTAPTFWWFDVTAHINPAFNITVGQVAMPLDRQGESSSGASAMVEAPITLTQEDGLQNRTIARQAFSNPVTLGLRLWGDVGRFHYILGAGNGEDYTTFNATRQFAYGARAAVDILGNPGSDESDFAYSETPKWDFGMGSSFDPQNATDPNVAGATHTWSALAAADTMFKWRGFALQAIAYGRKNKLTGTRTGTFDDLGYLAQAGYFVVPKKVEIVLRGSQIYREGPDNNAYEFGGGVNWYIHGHNIKLQTDAIRKVDFDATEFTAGGLATHQIRTMLTLSI